MGLLLRFLVVAVLSFAMFALFHVARDAQAVGGDPSTFIVCYAGVVALGALAAAVLTFMLLPALGDFLAGWLFSSNQQIEKHPHSAALAKVAAGDYHGAIDEYRSVLADNPMDMLAVREIVHIYVDKLHDREAGVEFLQDALQAGPWTDIQRHLLVARLKEING